MSGSSPVAWLSALIGYVAACVAGVHLLKHSMRPLDGEAWLFGMSFRQCAEFAGGFATAGLVPVGDRSGHLPGNVILLVSRERGPTGTAAFVISEDELLARFP